MAYLPNEWKDQVVQRPKTYQMNNNDDGSVTLIDSFGLVTELGTPVNEDYMNHIEQGIAGCAIRYYSTAETFNANEVVLNATEDGEVKFWKSLSDNNKNNPLTDETKWEEISLGGGSGLEVLDIGIAPCGIDETENKRRYTNGQLIIQEQFPVFTSKLKSRVGWNAESKTATLLPNLVKTETDWQATKLLSDYGQVGAFVIDDGAGTIRLPAVVNIQGLFDLQNAGLTVAAGLPNIRGQIDYRNGSTGSQSCFEGYTNQGSGAFAGCQSTRNIRGIADYTSNVTQIGLFDFNASNSNSTYSDDCETVQPEAIQYPYFIQVATGAEYEEPVINEYTVTSAYSYGMSQYYPGIMNNNSWLRSNGQWNSGDVYVGLYDWILANVNSGVEGFKGQIGYGYADTDNTHYYWISTTTPAVGMTVYGYANPIMPCGEIASVFENGFTFIDTVNSQQYTLYRNSSRDDTDTEHWITDYDYVINTTNETFRLPLLDGSEDLPGDFSNLDYVTTTDNSSFTMAKNGWAVADIRTATAGHCNVYINGQSIGSSGVSSSIATDGVVTALCRRGDIISWENLYNGSVKVSYFKGNGNLYYYCGNVEQNTQLVNVARIEEKLVDCLTVNDKAEITRWGFPSEEYEDLALGASGQEYTMKKDGLLLFQIQALTASQIIAIDVLNSNGDLIIGDYGAVAAAPQTLSLSLELPAGIKYRLRYNANGQTKVHRVFYAKGVQ